MGASADTAAVERWLSSRQADASPDAKLAPGEVVGGWRVQAFLGAGLSAEVYRVTNVRFGQEGALKLLVDGTRGLRERFLTEADAIRFLSMRALPRYMDSGELGGMPFYVMEYLRPLPEQMPRGDVPRFMIRVAKAVQALHEAGYIHRDLKPGNVMRRAGGEPVLIDLGLIKKRGIGVADSIVRLIPGALTDETSALSDSFQDGLLSPPVYTRPAEFNGWKVPEVLLSGNPRLIAEWQDEQALERTKRLRPELIAK